MRNILLILMVFLTGWQTAMATRPSVHASNFRVTIITCNSMQLNWTYGDGAARLIVAKEGSAPTWSPADDTPYSANPEFGKGTPYAGFSGNDSNFILYNAGGTNFVRVDSLKTGKTYYFVIYEHDNASGSTKYFTTGAPMIYDSCYKIKLDFSLKASDSCEQHNLFQFTNKSKSNIPGITYTFTYGDAFSSVCLPGDSVKHIYKNKSGQINVLINASPSLGCLSSFKRVVRVYPKRVAYIDFTKFDDTQCLEGNRFVIDPQPLISPLPKSFTYNWNFGDGSTISTFKKMQYTYKDSGHYKVEVEIVTNVNLDTTSCKDTLRFNVFVLPSPVGSAGVLNDDTVQCLTGNLFTFDNPGKNLNFYKWIYGFYGNRDSTTLKTFSHHYTTVGRDTIYHVAHALTGCKGRDTIIIEVLPDLNSDFVGLSPQYCSSNTPVKIIPAVKGGVFRDYLIDTNNMIIPIVIGKHQLTYIVNTVYCEDTTTKLFEVFPTPQPNLGADVAICNGGSHILNANYSPGNYLWNTNETTSSIVINTTGKYWVKITSADNCPASDTVDVIYSTVPVIELGEDTSVCKGNKLVLNVSSPNSTYLWQDGSTDSIFYVYEPGMYTVKVTNPCGVVWDSINVFFQTDYCDLFMANAFSPDNDLINAVFMPMGKNISVELFQIYNRWGQLVFETDKDNVGWNGQYMGKAAPQDLYMWKLFYTTPSGLYIKKSNAAGTLMLLR